MAKGYSQKKADGSALQFEAQLWAAAEQAVPAPHLLVAMLEPYKGRVFDPCCGSGGMFVSSEIFVEEHGGRVGDIAVYGQESNYTTWKLARMNLAIHLLEPGENHRFNMRPNECARVL